MRAVRGAGGGGADAGAVGKISIVSPEFLISSQLRFWTAGHRFSVAQRAIAKFALRLE